MSSKGNGTNSYNIREIKIRVIKEFLDIVILCELKENLELTGYDLVVLQKNKFGVTLSPGTVYMTINSMYRRGLVDGRLDGRKTFYRLTETGESALQNIKWSCMELIEFMRCVFPFPHSST